MPSSSVALRGAGPSLVEPGLFAGWDTSLVPARAAERLARGVNLPGELRSRRPWSRDDGLCPMGAAESFSCRSRSSTADDHPGCEQSGTEDEELPLSSQLLVAVPEPSCRWQGREVIY